MNKLPPFTLKAL